MGLTKDYLRYVHSGVCGCIGSINGTISAVDASTCAVTACENITFYNMRTNEKVCEISDSSKSATCIKFSQDKRWLAVGFSDGSIRLYDRKNEEQSSVIFSGHKKGVNCLAFSNDGLTLASGGKDSTIILWDIVSESGLFRLSGHKESVTHIQFVRNDQFLISSSKDSFVKFWDISTHCCFYTLLDNRSEVYSFCLLNDESLLITASSELELLVFELNWLQETISGGAIEPEFKKALTDQVQQQQENILGDMQNRYLRVRLRGKVLRQCKGRALQIAVTSDQRILVCLGADKIMDIYRVFTSAEADKRLTKKLKNAKRKAARSEDSTTQVNEEDVRMDVTILITRIGDYRTSTKMKWIDFSTAYKHKEHDIIIYQAFSLMMNNTVISLQMTYDMNSNNITTDSIGNLDHLGHREDVRALSMASSNNIFVSGGGDKLMIWNSHSLRPVSSLCEDSMHDITSVLFATGDGHILAGTKAGHLFLWELSGCEMLESRSEHMGAIWSIVATVDKKGFITASADKTVKLWRYELVSEGTRKRLSVRVQRVLEVSDEALACTISPNGKFIIVGLLDNTAAVYFFDTFKFFISLYGHSLPVTCVAVSPDSKLVVTGSADKSIKIWGLDFGDCHKSFHAHDDVVSTVMFSPSEEMLVWSAGRDGKVKQWDAHKLKRVQVLNRHTSEVRALTQSNTGNFLFTASHDKSIRCWELTEEIIVLEEEEEIEREKDYEACLIDDEDVVVGEDVNAEAGLASVKTSQSILSAENIIEAVDILRSERVQLKDNPEHKEHPLISAYKSKSLDHFIVDTISRCRPSNIERSLLMVPLSYIADILSSLSVCVQKHYKIEFASKIAMFIIRVHHNHIINSLEILPVIEKLRLEMPEGIKEIRDLVGMNLAALELIQLEIEESQDVKLFTDMSQLTKKNKNVRKAIVKANR